MVHWSKGPRAAETRAKISASKMGHVRSPEATEKQRAKMKGRMPKNWEQIKPLANINRRVPSKVCPACKTTFQRWPRSRKYCSRECSYTPGARKRGKSSHAGPRHHNWKGGITPKNRLIRTSTEYKAWRDAVFERDQYTCQRCGQHGGDLHADHIQPFALYPDLRLVVSNGRTLCPPCHRVIGAKPYTIPTKTQVRYKQKLRRLCPS